MLNSKKILVGYDSIIYNVQKCELITTRVKTPLGKNRCRLHLSSHLLSCYRSYFRASSTASSGHPARCSHLWVRWCRLCQGRCGWHRHTSKCSAEPVSGRKGQWTAGEFWRVFSKDHYSRFWMFKLFLTLGPGM